jgi:replicative DNA helicase
VTAVDERTVTAEEAVLGAVMLGPGAIADLAPMLEPGDFYQPKHQLIYAAALALYEQGTPTDPITVAAELHRAGDLARAGGAPYLHHLMAGVPTVGNAVFYAREIVGQATDRRLVAAASRITVIAKTPGDLVERLELAEETLRSVMPETAGNGAQQLGDLVDPLIDDIESGAGPDGIPTGYNSLDVYLNPMQAGQLIVIGARPSVGKSIVALDVARYVAIHTGEPAGVASLEMSRREVTLRGLAAEARVPLDRLQRRELEEADWIRIAKARDRIAGAPLYVDDSDTQTLASLRAFVRRHKLRVLAVDYLQLMRMPTTAASRREGIEETTRGLKLMAKAEQVVVVLLSQLSRKSVDRRDGRPDLADLRESGGIENDADVVILLHRPDTDHRKGEVDLWIAKQRNGPGQLAVALAAQDHYSRFVDLAEYS